MSVPPSFGSYQGVISAPPSFASYQGMAKVMPQNRRNSSGFSRWGLAYHTFREPYLSFPASPRLL